jgi:O-antigen ligase
MFKKPAVITFAVSFGIILLLLLLTEPIFSFLHHFAFKNLESSLLEPLFFGTLSVIAASVFILFFNQTIQLRWWRWARWVMLGSIPLILTGTTSGYAWLRRTDMAILCGSVLLGSTIVYALVQRFHYRTGVDS